LENMTSQIAVVVAALNEEKGIGPTLEELRGVLRHPHIVVVDGNSVDRTVEIAKDMGARVMLQDGTGKGNAMVQGLQRLSPNVRFVVFTDADFTYPAEYIPKMLAVLEQDPDVGMVIGDRFNGEVNIQRSWTNPFYMGNRLIALAQHVLNGIRLNDPLSGMRVVRAFLLRKWEPKSQGFDVEAELNFLVEREGFRIVEIPIDYRSRLGEKKLKLRHGLGILKRIVSESFTM
jgi:glycosyltransferase involved in cell wall biosynthesis